MQSHPGCVHVYIDCAVVMLVTGTLQCLDKRAPIRCLSSPAMCGIILVETHCQHCAAAVGLITGTDVLTATVT
jgi:hypothetical protein